VFCCFHIILGIRIAIYNIYTNIRISIVSHPAPIRYKSMAKRIVRGKKVVFNALSVEQAKSELRARTWDPEDIFGDKWYQNDGKLCKLSINAILGDGRKKRFLITAQVVFGGETFDGESFPSEVVFPHR